MGFLASIAAAIGNKCPRGGLEHRLCFCCFIQLTNERFGVISEGGNTWCRRRKRIRDVGGAGYIHVRRATATLAVRQAVSLFQEARVERGAGCRKW